MLRITVILFIVILCNRFCDIFAQEDLIWTDSVVTYRFSSPTDSCRLHKESNFHLEVDTSIHITSVWDTAMSAWVNEYKSVGIYHQTTNSLEMQNYFWNGKDAWIGSIRSVFWYGSKGEIAQLRSDSWDQRSNKNNWIRKDSIIERWEKENLILVTEEYRWFEDSLSWELIKSRRLEKIKNEEDIISAEYNSRLDTSTLEWVPVFHSQITYDSLGNPAHKSTRFWSEIGEYWFDYVKQEFYYDKILDMRMEEKYEWDFWRSDWTLKFRFGISVGESPGMSYIIGIKDNRFQRWEIYEKVVSERDSSQLIIKNSVSTKSYILGEWENKSQTRNFYNAKEQPILVVSSKWNEEAGAYEVDRKKYFYYPWAVGSQKHEIVDAGYKIYPNPTTSNIHIEGPNSFQVAYIFNLQGKLLKSTGKREIDVSGFPAGLYLIRILDRNGMNENLLFIRL